MKLFEFRILYSVDVMIDMHNGNTGGETMGQKDTILKRYFSDEACFADLINGVIGAGKKLVVAEQVIDLDSQVGIRMPESISEPNDVTAKKGSKTGHKKIRPRYRDLVRKIALGMNFVVIGIEEQEHTHYLMPVRCMGYDLREYERQVDKDSAQTMREYEEKLIHLSREEFLSGFRKNGKLRPCITLVLYFGDDWDGATSLHQLLDYEGIPEEFRPFINDYQVFILNVKKLNNTDVFHSDIKLVFDSIRYASDKEAFRKKVLENEAYGRLRGDAYDVICQYANLQEMDGISVRTCEKGEGNMCKAMLELIEEGREEGRDKMLISLVCKKKKRGFNVEQIAEALEEALEKIESICMAIEVCGTYEDHDRIYRQWKDCITAHI